MSLIDLPVLFKRTSTGAVQQWQIRVEPHDDGTATIITTHGQVDGQQQEARDHIKEGKNPGKRNETTAQEQAIAEATAKWTKQLERNHYGRTVAESEMKKACAPMLAHVFQDHADKVIWGDSEHLHVQPKFDGHRCLAFCDDTGQVKLFSRKATEIVTCPHLIEQRSRLMTPGCAFDGELYIHGVSLNTIGSYIKRAQDGSADLCFMLYDQMSPDSFRDRFAVLQQRYDRGDHPHIHLARTQPVDTTDAAEEFQAEAIDNGYEGAMLRHGTKGYEAGKRSQSLLKMKTFVDDEFVIVGCREGRGTYAGMAVFECVTSADNKFDVTAPGTHEEKRAAWENHQQYLGKKLTVKFQRYTDTAEPVPFLPVAKGFVDASE